MRHGDELQTICLSEKGRYITFIGRVKEDVKNLREIHSVMDPQWTELLSCNKTVLALSGDLKYMLTMLGHTGASATYPCPCCARSRALLAWRSWVPEELAYIKQMQPNTFVHSEQQPRCYPANPACPHDVKNHTCLCVDKCAEYVHSEVAKAFPVDIDQHELHAQDAPFHKLQTKISREYAYSCCCMPLMPDIPADHRLPGIWHATHNTRVMMWLMVKDICAQCGVVPALQQSLVDVGLPHIKVSADKKPRKQANIEDQITNENLAAAVAISKEEDTVRNKRSAMNGKELVTVFENFETVVAKMHASTEDACEKLKLERWEPPFRRALTAFNKGCEVALADLWPTNRSAELSYFRTFVDEIMNIPASAGLPYVVREYLAILPIHYLAEPSHLQGMSCNIYDQHGVAPGSGSDATTEMVRNSPVLNFPFKN